MTSYIRFGDSPNDDYKDYSLWGCDARSLVDMY